jgi:hypothetical protein
MRDSLGSTKRGKQFFEKCYVSHALEPPVFFLSFVSTYSIQLLLHIAALFPPMSSAPIHILILKKRFFFLLALFFLSRMAYNEESRRDRKERKETERERKEAECTKKNVMMMTRFL